MASDSELEVASGTDSASAPPQNRFSADIPADVRGMNRGRLELEVVRLRAELEEMRQYQRWLAFGNGVSDGSLSAAPGLTISELIRGAHATATEKGWWEGPERSVGDQFANFHAEISEAWEEFRKFGIELDRMIYYAEVTDSSGESGKPEGLAVELADLFIRVADTCGKYNIPLEEALRLKMAYNQTRPYRHGNKHA